MQVGTSHYAMIMALRSNRMQRSKSRKVRHLSTSGRQRADAGGTGGHLELPTLSSAFIAFRNVRNIMHQRQRHVTKTRTVVSPFTRLQVTPPEISNLQHTKPQSACTIAVIT